VRADHVERCVHERAIRRGVARGPVKMGPHRPEKATAPDAWRPEPSHSSRPWRRAVQLQLAVETEAPLPRPWQVLEKTLFTMPPRANTMTTISAAIAATSRPYSTAEAPRSSLEAARRRRTELMTFTPVCRALDRAGCAPVKQGKRYEWDKADENLLHCRKR